eukprot:2390511-Prymnesium_polylepis.1
MSAITATSVRGLLARSFIAISAQPFRHGDDYAAERVADGHDAQVLLLWLRARVQEEKCGGTALAALPIPHSDVGDLAGFLDHALTATKSSV